MTPIVMLILFVWAGWFRSTSQRRAAAIA
jgi:hypothetical protein